MSTTDASQIHDLRSALDFLREMPGQLLETDTQVDPDAEVSGVYRHVGAGGTVMRPTKEGPAMVFNNVKGFDDAKVCIGMLASRKRVAALLDLDEVTVLSFRQNLLLSRLLSFPFQRARNSCRLLRKDSLRLSMNCALPA